MLSHELRQAYVNFFVERGHLHLPGAPIVPIDALGVEDTSTLFTSAGMQQFKPYFTGDASAPRGRVTTVQKCVRTGDIDSVGDMSHLTLFEMLGNFSFGDYFKSEVIPWTWEFLTGVVGLDADRLCVTVYHEDDEAFAVWRDVVGLPEDRIHRLGGDKNFWPANAFEDGPNGPCGPCSEVFYRVAPLEQMTSDPALTPAQRYKVDDSAGRWLEVWNNVFTQFDRGVGEDGKPILTPLPNRNNDTGAGFERILCLTQGVTSVYETDLFRGAIALVERLSGQAYGGTSAPVDVAMRVVAEHTRTAAFCVADGILPSNEGRGYVLRRIMRRAIRFGRTALGLTEPFMHLVAPACMEAMGGDFPELIERRDHIVRTLNAEEERFLRTLDNGMTRLQDALRTEGVQSAGTLGGADAFTLYDTFGFPLELTQEIAAEQGITVDHEGFRREMEDQRRRSQEASGIGRDLFTSMGAALAELQRTQLPTAFTGYDDLTLAGASVAAIIRGGELVTFAREGEEIEIVLDRTPFYGESGGQVGDTGAIEAGELRIEVTDTRKVYGLHLHAGRVVSGRVALDDLVTARVDVCRRRDIARNHTATHLLHAALRAVLGAHVHQKGSLVAPDRLRFDLTHTQPVSREELERVEIMANDWVLADHAVLIDTDVPVGEARARGAMALFGEKYGERVRVVEAPGVSIELCGGAHVARTSQIGLIRVLSETGVAAGVRRIEAVTGAGAVAWVRRREDLLDRIAGALKTSTRDVAEAVDRLLAQRTQLEKQVQELRTGVAGQVEIAEAEVAGVRLLTGALPGADAETVGARADALARERGSAIVVLGGENGGKVAFAVKVTPDLVKRGFHAGNLVREVARVAGGGGGGRPDFAQAGGRDPAKLADALASAAAIVAAQAD